MTQHLQGGNGWKGHSPNCGSTALAAQRTIWTKVTRMYSLAECCWQLLLQAPCCLTLGAFTTPAFQLKARLKKGLSPTPEKDRGWPAGCRLTITVQGQPERHRIPTECDITGLHGPS